MPKGKPAGELSPRKEKITAWVDGDLLEKLKGIAAESDLTASEVVNALLRKAVMHSQSERFWDVAGAQLERRIKTEVSSLGDRLARLMARTALEAASTRELVTTDLLARHDREEVKVWREAAWKRAVDGVRKPSRAVAELLGEGVAE